MKSNVFVGVKPMVGAVNGTETDLKDDVDYILAPVTNGRYREIVSRVISENRKSGDPLDHYSIDVPEPQLQEIGIPPFNDDPKQYIGLLASWLDLETADPVLRDVAFQVLLNECKYARFIGVSKLIVAPPKNVLEIQKYARMVADLLNDPVVTEMPQLTLSISLPLCELSDPLATWELWNTIKNLCGAHECLTVSLALPKNKTPTHVLERWLTEPVSCLLLSSSIFVTNQHGFPVLQKYNQNIIFKFQEINGRNMLGQNELCIIMHGLEKFANDVKGGKASFINYINFILKKGDKLILQNMSKMLKACEKLAEPRILPQLKPHSEDLSNQTYALFEEDIVKYDLYEVAIKDAILENTKIWKNRGSSFITILVAGAGRGPLVDRVFKVLQELSILSECRVIAIEKNSRAYLYLQKRNFDKWQNRVTLINEDIQNWQINMAESQRTKVDLCISELLGSFGCNELSPECLLSLQKYHSQKETVYIPQSYSSYIAPIACPVLDMQLQKMCKQDLHVNVTQQPWVLHNIPYQTLSSKVNELWTFSHPMSEASNLQHDIVSEFKIKHRAEVNALIGYFSAVLYGDVILSIVPEGTIVRVPQSKNNHEGEALHSTPDKSAHTNDNKYYFKKIDKTPGLTSWSPMIFPLSQPLLVSDDTELSVMMSRRHNGRYTWYEWSLESYVYMVVTSTSTASDATMEVITPNNNAHNVTQEESKRVTSPHPYAPGWTFSANKSKDAQPLSKRKISNSSPFDKQQKLYSGRVSIDNEEMHHQDFEEGDTNNQINGWTNGWTSVNDLHRATEAIVPAYDIGNDPQEKIEKEKEKEKEVHIRVKTGVTMLHNSRGRYSRIELR